MTTTMIISICFCLLALSISSVTAEPRSVLCDGGSYTEKSPFQSNLNALLASLSSTNANFFTDTKGQAPNEAYGLVLCRGDVSPSDCSACLSDAAKDVPASCPLSKQATIWYDNCELRSSDVSFFSVVSTKTKIWWNPSDVLDIDPFLRLKKKLLDKVTSLAASNTTLKFATGIATNWSNTQTIFGLAQCTRDLSAEACDQCLQEIRGALKNYAVKNGGTIFGQSCNLRYEAYRFFVGRPTVSLEFASSTPHPSPPTTPPSSASKGEDSHRI